MSIKKYAQNIQNKTGTYPDIEPYKRWDNLDNLSSANGTAYCRNPSSSSPLVAGRNGTYRQPCPIDFRDFGFNIDTDLSIEKVVVHYQHQTFENNGYYAGFGGATVTLLGTNISSKTGNSVPSTLSSDSVTFYGVTVNELNSSNFGVRFAYPSNSATTPGRIELKDFYVEVFTNIDGINISLNSEWSENPVTVGGDGVVRFTVRKTSDAAYTPQIRIEFPLGIEQGGVNDGSGNYDYITEDWEQYGDYERSIIVWEPHLPATSNSTSTAMVEFLFDATAVSETINVSGVDVRACTMTDTITHTTYMNKVTVEYPRIELKTNFFKNKVSFPAGRNNGGIYFEVNSNDPTGVMKEVYIDFGTGNTITNIDAIRNTSGVRSVTTYNNNTRIRVRVPHNAQGLRIPIIFNPSRDGEYTLNAYITDEGSSMIIRGTQINYTYLVRPSTLTSLGFTRLLVSDEWVGNLESGYNYTVGSMCQVELLNDGYSVFDYGNNFRLGVFNTSGDVTDEDEFLAGVIWSDNAAGTTLSEQKVTFKYDANYPLYLVWSDTYLNDALASHSVFHFSEPLMVESQYYESTASVGHTFYPVKALLDNTEYSHARMYPSIPETMPIAVNGWSDGGLFTQNISPLGMTILMDYATSVPVMIRCELYIDDNHVGYRDITVQEGQGRVQFGSAYDLFGLKPSDFVNSNFNFEARISVLNIYELRGLVEINNLRCIMNYIYRETCGFGVIVDGENSRDYGFKLIEITPTWSTNNEKQEYKVTGTDNTVINRLNIDPKDIKLRVMVASCKYNENVYLIDKLVELFTNERELRSNKPIPKDLIFEHMPDRRFPFVRVKEFDGEYKGANYYADITLEIPSGTSYDVTRTVTGPNGRASANIVISPDIYYLSNTDGELLIYESSFEQEFLVQNSRIRDGSTIHIDTENRRVYLEDTNGDIDITASVDYNSNWFKLKGEYSFTSSTGIVTSVEYYVRR